MEVIGLGTAAGLIVAAACMMFYRKGVRDGMGVKKVAAPKTGFYSTKGNGEETMAMMKRYETILSYDPYQFPRSAFSGDPDGERV